MTSKRLIEYGEAAPEVRAVYDDILATRKTDYLNNFWIFGVMTNRDLFANILS